MSIISVVNFLQSFMSFFRRSIIQSVLSPIGLLPALWVAMLGLLLAACSTNENDGRASGADEKSIVILFEGDTHCETGGYSRFAGLRDAIRQADTAHVVTASLGDFMVGGALGAISKGSYITDIMRSVGYDVITIGNHEFDYGGEHMKELLGGLGVAVTCANFFDYGAETSVFAPYVVEQYGNRRVAFVGALAPETMQLQQHAFYDENGQLLYDLHPNDLYTLVQQAVDRARGEGHADCVVLLSHIGEKEAMGVSSHKLIAATRGIDAVIDSHSHTSVEGEYVQNADGKAIVITQAGDHMKHVGKMLIAADGTISTRIVAIDDITYDSPRVAAVVDSVKREAQAVSEMVICTSDYELTVADADGVPLVEHEETNGGDLVTDAFRVVMNAEIGLHTGNSFVKNVAAGKITYGDIVAMLPYENSMSVIEVTGQQLLDMLAKCTQKTPKNDWQFPQVSGMRFTVHTATHSVSDVEILDKAKNAYLPLDPQRTYSVALSSYYRGGGFYNMLKDCPVKRATTLMVRDVVIDYMSKTLGGTLGDAYRKAQGRITIVE